MKRLGEIRAFSVFRAIFAFFVGILLGMMILTNKKGLRISSKPFIFLW